MSELMDRLKQAVLDGDEDEALAAAEEAIAEGMEPLAIVEQSIQPAMDEIGEAFQNGDAFLPELIIAGDAATKALDVIMANLPEDSGLNRGTVVIGVMYGDNHDIGKNLVLAVLAANGFKVIDMGVNCTPKSLVDAAIKENANIIAGSTLITTSIPYTRELIGLLEAMGKRDDFFCVFGGGPVTPDWVRQINADGYGRDAKDAVVLGKKLEEAGKRTNLSGPVIENALANA